MQNSIDITSDLGPKNFEVMWQCEKLVKRNPQKVSKCTMSELDADEEFHNADGNRKPTKCSHLFNRFSANDK